MSEANYGSTSGSGDLFRGGRIWQRDELLLILRSTNRCLPPEDVAKFVDLLESVLPADRVIPFQGIHEIRKQLDQMERWELVEKRGSCYRTTEKGNKLADEAQLSMEKDEKTAKTWVILRNALGNLPSSKLTWDSYLNATLKGLMGETKAC